MTTDSASPRRGSRWVPVIIVIILVIAAGLLWRNYEERRQREAALSTMVTALQKQNQLTVFKAQIATVVTNSLGRVGGLFPAEQTAVIPATVEYRLDLSQMKPSDMEWDPDSQRMLVTLPPLTFGSLNLDEERARYFRKGILVSGKAQEELTRRNTQSARKEAVREARNPELVRLAKVAAREAMRANVLVPLQAAGFENAAVEVRFAGEGEEADPSYLDRSTSYNEAIEEARRRRAAQGQK